MTTEQRLEQVRVKTEFVSRLLAVGDDLTEDQLAAFEKEWEQIVAWQEATNC